MWIEGPGDLINDESILVESDLPILVFHDVTSGRDAFPVIPFLDQEWFGVASTRGHYGANTNGTHVDEYRSDTSAEVDWALNRGTHVRTARGGGQGGGPEAGVRLVLDTSALPDPQISPVGAQFNAINQADQDGFESVSFFPAQELNSRYVLPTDSQYISISCPVPGTVVQITPATGPATLMTCQGVDTVGWATDTQLLSTAPSTSDLAGNVVPGTATTVESLGGEAFFLYYEHDATEDETNVLGMKQARQYTWPEPVITDRVEGLFPSEGFWLSPELALPTGTRVFGQIDFETTTPTGTDIQVQVATDSAPAPTSYAGPDGTSGTSFGPSGLPSVLDFAHDGDAFVRVRVKLVTADRTISPRLSRITLDHSLPALARDLALPTVISTSVGVDPLPTEVYLLRVKTQNPNTAGSSIALFVDAVGAAVVDLNLRLENVAAGIDAPQVGSPASAGPQPFEQSTSYSVLGVISLDAPTSTSSADGRLQIDVGSSGILAETDIQMDFSTP